MVNKNQFKITNNKKILHKIGKHWVVVSAMALALLGGVSYSSTLTQSSAHAANLQSTESVASSGNTKATQSTNSQGSNQANSTNSGGSMNPTSAKSINNKNQGTNGIDNQATKLHGALLNNAMNNNTHALGATLHFNVGGTRDTNNQVSDTLKFHQSYTSNNIHFHSDGNGHYRGNKNSVNPYVSKLANDLNNGQSISDDIPKHYYVTTYSQKKIRKALNKEKSFDYGNTNLSIPVRISPYNTINFVNSDNQVVSTLRSDYEPSISDPNKSDLDASAQTILSDLASDQNSDQFMKDEQGNYPASDYLVNSDFKKLKSYVNTNYSNYSSGVTYGSVKNFNIPLHLKHGIIAVNYIMPTKNASQASLNVGGKNYKIVHNNATHKYGALAYNLPYGYDLSGQTLINFQSNSAQQLNYKNVVPSDYQVIPPHNEDGVPVFWYVNQNNSFIPATTGVDPSDFTKFQNNGSVTNFYAFVKPIQASASIDFMLNSKPNVKSKKLSQSVDLGKQDISDMNTDKLSNTIKTIQSDVKGTSQSYQSDIKNLRKSNLLADTATIKPNDLHTLANQVKNVNLSHLENVHITVPEESVYKPIIIKYVDKNNQPIADNDVIYDKNLSDGFNMSNDYNPTDPNHYDTAYSGITSSNNGEYNFDNPTITGMTNKFTMSPQPIIVKYNFADYKKDSKDRHNNAPQGKGNLDVFYYYGNQLQQYKNYGNFTVGTPLYNDAFTKQGFTYVNGTSDVKSIKQGSQGIALRSNGKSPLQLPQQKDVVASNVFDNITYINPKGQQVGQWTNSGYNNKEDNKFVSDAEYLAHPNEEAYADDVSTSDANVLPIQWRVSPESQKKFDNQFSGILNSDNHGNNRFTFNVIPNTHDLVTQYVNIMHPNDKIAPDSIVKAVADSPITLPKVSNAKQGYNLNSGKIITINGKSADHIIKMPNNNTIVAIGYTPESIKAEYQNTIKLVTPNNTIKTISDNSSNNNNWNLFESGLRASQAEKKPFIFTNNGAQYMIPYTKNSDMDSDVNTLKTTISDMDKQNDTTSNPFKSVNEDTSKQTKSITIPVQELGTINVQFVDTSEGNQVVPLNNMKSSDSSVHINNNTISNTGYANTTTNLNGNNYNLPSILDNLIPKGYELTKNNDEFHQPSSFRENIVKKNGLIEFNGDNVNSSIDFVDNPQDIQIGIRPIPKPVYSYITVNFLDGDKNNKVIAPSVTTRGQKGQEFNLIADEDKPLTINGQVGYSFVDAINRSNNANSYAYVGNDQTIDLVYAEIKGRINVNFIDRSTGNKYLPNNQPFVIHGLVGTSFNNDESYLAQIPNNYYYDGISDNNVNEFLNKDQNINVYMEPVKPATARTSSIQVNYVDNKSGNVIEKAGAVSDAIGEPFDVTSYTQSQAIPDGYKYVGIKNDVHNFGSNNATVDVLVGKKSSIQVNYVDNTGHIVGKATPVSDVIGNPFNVSYYEQSNVVPQHYEYSHVNGNAPTTFGNNNQTVNITVNKVVNPNQHNNNKPNNPSNTPTPQVQKSTIYVNYRDDKSGVIVKSLNFTKPVNTVFDIDGYVHALPQNYKLNYVANPTNEFAKDNQTVDVYMTNTTEPTSGVIDVHYIDAQTGQQLTNNVLVKGNNNASYDYGSNMKSFSDYTFDKNASSNLNVNKFNNGTQYITLAFDKNKCDINVEFVDGTGKVLKTVPTSASANTPFNASDYKNDVPSGYEIKNMSHTVNTYNYKPQTFIINVAKPSIHTITVNYIDKATNQIILTKSATNDAGTPFNIDNYITYIPKGYNWTNIPNNAVSQFDNNNHTYNIILSQINPAKPIQYGTIGIRYVNAANISDVIGIGSSITRSIGTSYDINNYMNIPKGYSYAGIENNENITKFSNGNHIINVLVSKNVPAPKPQPQPKPASKAASSSSNANAGGSYVINLPSDETSVAPAPSTSSSTSSSENSYAKPSMPSSSASNQQYTNLHYPIDYGATMSKPDKVIYKSHKYDVHYHVNGRNTIYVPTNYTRHKHHYTRYHQVLVSTNLPVPDASSDNLVRMVDRINFGKHVTKRVKNLKQLNKAISSIKAGQIIEYKGNKLSKVNDFGHWRYFMISKDVLAHNLITNVGSGTKKDLVNMLRTNHEHTFFINTIAVVHGKHANYIRYEFRYKNHDFWITGRTDYVPNAYWQKDELHSSSKKARVLVPCYEYSSPKYSKRTYRKTVYRGTILHIKRVVFINKPSYEQTRFQLTNGRYVTANKNWVKLLKK